MSVHRGPVEPGMRDRLVTIQSLTEGIDPISREPTETWATLVASVPAARMDIRGIERQIAHQESSKFDRRWLIPYRLDMDPDLVNVAKVRRFVVEGFVEDVVSAEEVGRREGIEVTTLRTFRAAE